MKYIFQLMIIFGVSLAGELLNILIPFPIPASVYGLVIMFVLLLTKVVRLDQVENAAEFLMAVMPIFFIEPSVKVMETFGLIKGDLPILFLAAFLSFAAVIAVTGVTSQIMIKWKNRKGR